MANLYDYLVWRGDLDFAQAPLNPVDNLILAWLSYADFTGIVPEMGNPDSITVAEAADRFFDTHERLGKVDLVTSINPMLTSTQLLEKLAATRRFGPLRLTHFASELDYEQEKQFAALTVLIGEGLAYVSYRGTDHSIVGWKEDFCMSFMPSVPAQHEALEYLERVACSQGVAERRLYVGGHSKGGNLAMYAATTCGCAVQDRIVAVYNNDGPGFGKELVASEAYRRVLDRIETITPRSSIVGLLLEHEERYTIVKSAQISLFQHNALNWEVLGTQFVAAPAVDRSSALLDLTLKEWLRTLDEEHLREFVDTLFAVLEETGARTLEELTEKKLKLAGNLFKTLINLDAETRGMLLHMAGTLMKAQKRAKQDLRALKENPIEPAQIENTETALDSY